MKKFLYPSVSESFGSTLVNVTTDRASGIKIQHKNEDYIIGHLALSEGKAPHKGINSAPDDLDYQLLLKSGLVIAADYSLDKPISLTTGFPHATFNIFKTAASDYISKLDTIRQDTRPYGGPGYEDVEVNLERINIIPELFGSIIAAREGDMNIRGNMFVVSMGYGTLEFGLCTDNGFIQRTLNSGNGLRYAIDSAMKEMATTHYLGLRTEHQFDQALKNGSITINRKRIDLTEIRKTVMKQYYNNVISPLIQNTWIDEDFNKSSTLVLVGGGANYPELVNCFHDEFKGLLKIEIPDDPLTMAATGYCLHSANKRSAPDTLSLGLDIGNAHTCVTILE
jgi:plasmid segregation protein ParM